MVPGVVERRTHNCIRHGTTSPYAALNVASGFAIGKTYKRHRAAEFLDFLKEIDAGAPKGLDVHIIEPPRVCRWLFRLSHTAMAGS